MEQQTSLPLYVSADGTLEARQAALAELEPALKACVLNLAPGDPWQPVLARFRRQVLRELGQGHLASA